MDQSEVFAKMKISWGFRSISYCKASSEAKKRIAFNFAISGKCKSPIAVKNPHFSKNNFGSTPDWSINSINSPKPKINSSKPVAPASAYLLKLKLKPLKFLDLGQIANTSFNTKIASSKLFPSSKSKSIGDHTKPPLSLFSSTLMLLVQARKAFKANNGSPNGLIKIEMNSGCTPFRT